MMNSLFGRQWLFVPVLAASAAVGCGGATQNDISGQGGTAGMGGQANDAGGSENANDAGDSGSSKCPVPHCPFDFEHIMTSSELENCSFQMKRDPYDESSLSVFVNCTLVQFHGVDAGGSWYLDFTREPSYLVFVGATCDQIRVSHDVVVNVYGTCGLV